MKKRSPGQKKVLAGLIAAEILTAAALGGFFWYLHSTRQAFPWQDYPVSMHALGSLDDRTYLNSREGFEHYYKQGCRMFEVDLAQTSDQVWVCRHKWQKPRGQWKGKKKKVLSAEQFLGSPLFGEYTPLSLENLFNLLMDSPEAYVILDSKNYSTRNFDNTVEDFTGIVETARSAGCEAALSRVIPEVYNQEMYEGLSSVYDFPAFLYSFWEEVTLEEMEEAAVFCEENGISGVSISEEWWSRQAQELFDKHNLPVMVYTVNDELKARQLLAAGVATVCTDVLTPADLQEEQ